MIQATAEQQSAREAFASGGDLALIAGAGAGKTSTLVLMGSATRRRGLYMAWLGAVERPDAVLCRSNADAMREVLAHLDQGTPVALVGGGKQLRLLAEAAIDLKAGRRTGWPNTCRTPGSCTCSTSSPPPLCPTRSSRSRSAPLTGSRSATPSTTASGSPSDPGSATRWPTVWISSVAATRYPERPNLRRGLRCTWPEATCKPRYAATFPALRLSTMRN